MTADNDAAHVNRLLDIMVEEVSLVDRAANKHRFLVIKRSAEMDNLQSSAEDALDLNTEAEKMDHDESMDNGHQTDDHGGMHGAVLSASVQALERLTEAVELLQTQDEASTASLVELAHDLHRIATHLASMAGGTDAP